MNILVESMLQVLTKIGKTVIGLLLRCLLFESRGFPEEKQVPWLLRYMYSVDQFCSDDLRLD